MRAQLNDYKSEQPAVSPTKNTYLLKQLATVQAQSIYLRDGEVVLYRRKHAVEVGAEKDLVGVLDVIKAAVLAGELDTAIENAANKLRDGFIA